MRPGRAADHSPPSSAGPVTEKLCIYLLLHLPKVCVSLAMRHAKHMRRFILSSLACLAVQYFSILSYKRQDFREKVTKNEVCFDFLCKFV